MERSVVTRRSSDLTDAERQHLGYGLLEFGRINSESYSIDCAILNPKQMGWDFRSGAWKRRGAIRLIRISIRMNPHSQVLRDRRILTGSLGASRDLHLRITLQPVRTELK